MDGINGVIMKLWEKIYSKGIKTQEELKKAKWSLARCTSMSKDERLREESALEINYCVNNGWI